MAEANLMTVFLINVITIVLGIAVTVTSYIKV